MSIKGYVHFHVYDRDGRYLGGLDASHAGNALAGARDVYGRESDVWFVSRLVYKP